MASKTLKRMTKAEIQARENWFDRSRTFILKSAKLPEKVIRHLDTTIYGLEAMVQTFPFIMTEEEYRRDRSMISEALGRGFEELRKDKARARRSALAMARLRKLAGKQAVAR